MLTGMEGEQEPWDQLSGESDAAYARFLFYLEIGPQRSIDEAYRQWNEKRPKTARKRSKTPQAANGQWKDDSAKYRWIERSLAWDRKQFTLKAERAVDRFVEVLLEGMATTIEAMRTRKPTSWNQILESIRVFGQHVPPETIRARMANYPGSSGAGREQEPAGDIPERPPGVRPERAEAANDADASGGVPATSPATPSRLPEERA
jgi:hypothetical protein